MQFTVLIEFLVPGLATTVLLLFLLLDGAVPRLPEGLPMSEPVSALLLLAVSYPVGILTNFPLFLLQRRLVSRGVRRRVFDRYAERGFDLTTLVAERLGIRYDDLSGVSHEKIQLLFHLMGAFAFSKNVERMHLNHIYHEGLQRLARGVLLPLLLAVYVFLKHRPPSWPVLTMFCLSLAALACLLVRHSVTAEYNQIARFFLALSDAEPRAAAPTPAPAARG